MPRSSIVSIIWTLFIIAVSGVLFVGLPYRAIVENSVLFWIFVCLGLAISAICSAAELAFGLACGESSLSDIYARNSNRSLEQKEIAEDTTKTAADRAKAEREAKKAQRLMQIGERYSNHYNPTLVVTNSVANMIVAVVSGLALFDAAQTTSAGVPCPWLTADSWISSHSPALRCYANLFGWLIPFPVNREVFQSALALTLILIVGEIVPKQLAAAFPEAATHLLFPIPYRAVLLFSLGTGPAFGALGQLIKMMLGLFAGGAGPGGTPPPAASLAGAVPPEPEIPPEGSPPQEHQDKTAAADTNHAAQPLRDETSPGATRGGSDQIKGE
jgi:hypothetical protein